MKIARDDITSLEPLSSSIGKVSQGYRESEIAFRQLRYNTRNTLQRIVCLIAESPGIRRSPEDVAFSQDLVRRICLSAEIADSLFGLTRPAGNMHQRLLGVGNGLARTYANPGTEIGVDVSVEGNCPIFLTDPILQIVFELVGESIRRILCNKKPPEISIKLICLESHTILKVTIEGSNLSDEFMSSEGFQLAQSLAYVHKGRITFTNAGGTKIAVEFR